jgi:hypothetical protein
MSHSRYALYLTPPKDSDLWSFGCDVIGRDAWTGRSVGGFAPEGQSLETWRKLTSEPRRYGFHATLKAPFRLRVDLDVFDLMDAVAAVAHKRRPFDAGSLHVGHIAATGGRAFVALKPEGPSTELHSLEENEVRALDALRAPLTDAERGRRNAGRLTPRQRYYLDAWGYPYVIDEFRPHFTLTNPIEAEHAGRVTKALEWEFRLRVASTALRIDSIALFGERESDCEFEVLRAFPLGHVKRAKRISPRVAAAAFID